MSFLRHLLGFGLIALSLSLPVSAATGGPDTYGYTWRDNFDGCLQTSDLFTGAAITAVDTAAVVGPFDLGFSMPFLGQIVTQVWVSPNGYVTFTNEPDDPNIVDLPNPAAPRSMIAAAWRPTDGSSTITVEPFATEFHVRWVQKLGFLSMEFHLWLFPSGGFRISWTDGPFFSERLVGYQDATGTLGNTLVHMIDSDNFSVRDGAFPLLRANNSACVSHPILLDCSSPIAVACGETVAGNFPADPAASRAAFYSCAGTVYGGNEAIVELTVDSPGAVSIAVTGPADADLMRVSNFCREDFCLEIANTGTDRLDYPILFPGTYTYVVDKTSPGGGEALSVTVDCTSPFTDISCGDTLPGDTSLGASFRDDYSCTAGTFGAPEALYSFANPTLQTVSVELATADTNLWVFIFDRASFDGSGGRNCLAAGRGAARLFNAPAGDYVVLVDGEGAGGSPGSAFDISLTCGDPFGSIACADSMPGDTSLESNYLELYSCAAPALTGCEEMYRFTNPILQTLSITLDTLDPDLWVLLFSAADFDASQGSTCLAAGQGGVGLFNVAPGDYIVVVDGVNGACAPYTVNMACGGQLDCDSAVPVSCTQTIAGDTTASPTDASTYPCIATLLDGGEDVYRFFNPVEQTITASFVTSQPGQRLMLLPSCDEGTCYLAGDQGVSCALFPPGEYFLVVDSPRGDEGPYELNILCSEFVAGIDLRITNIDAAALTGDCRDFDVSGTAEVALTNLGTAPAPGPFDVTVFEDDSTNANGQFDPGADNVLGTFTFMGTLGAGETQFVDVPATGTVLFRDNVLYAIVDPDNTVAELQENNNLFDTGRACEFRPPVGDFSPVVEWTWTASTTEPTFTEVDTIPLVGDINLDGMPDIIFNTAPPAGGNRAPGIVRAISGDGRSEVWTATDPMARVWGRSQLAMGDIDGDGRPEVIGQAGATAADRNRLVAIDDDGSFMWLSDPFTTLTLDAGNFGGGGASIADLDCDGNVEIVFGPEVYNADGTLFWTPEPGGTWGRNVGTFGPDCPLSVVVDVNGDGQLDVVAGPTCYTWNAATGMGEILWTNPAIPDGHPAVGNFDSDDLPEIALSGNGNIYLLEGDTGALIWQRQIPRGGGGCNVTGLSGGPPTVADFDGDCAAEVGVAGADLYSVLETDGTVRWSSPINDCSSHRTASSVFDFEGDGAAEVAFQDQVLLRIFRGLDGTEIASIPASSHTWIEMISVADVDADNNAEIIMPLNRGGGGSGEWGIKVIGDDDDNWVNTRRIWNQHQYHINNVNDDGTIPGPSDGCESPSWRLHNTYRDQIGTAIFESPDLTISITDTVLIPKPDCFPDLQIFARVGNGGALDVGGPSFAAFYRDDPVTGPEQLESVIVPSLGPGEFRDFDVTVALPAFGFVDIFAVADDDGTGGTSTGIINECREDNNVCLVVVDNSESAGGLGDPPGAVGSGLRVTNRGDSHAADITATLDWTLDAALPRPPEEHYHVKRSTDPRMLSLILGTDPYVGLTYEDSTPAAIGCHYYRVLAADQCEQEETRDGTP